eukprot:11708738-Alexandrium_andersonii.AAC.1
MGQAGQPARGPTRQEQRRQDRAVRQVGARTEPQGRQVWPSRQPAQAAKAAAARAERQARPR